MTWLDQKNRPVITTISGEAILVSWKDRRWWRQPPTSLIGHSVPALLLVASFARAAVFDADGGFLYEIEDRGLLPAGFGIDGQCSVISVQDRPYGTAFVRLHDVTTGALLEQIDIRAIDDLLALGLDRPVTSQRSTDVGGKTSWGSWWHGRMMAEYDPDSKTTFLGFRIPTGEMRTVCGEPHAVVESRWVQVAITR